VPDGDLFKAIREGKVSVVTDQIERFIESGLLLRSGKTLAADIIVTATGFNLNVMGDIAFSVDGEPLVFADTVTYHGTDAAAFPAIDLANEIFRYASMLQSGDDTDEADLSSIARAGEASG